MRVYRIETEAGEGPFSHGARHGILRHLDYGLPEPDVEGITVLKPGSVWVSGCGSAVALKRNWFPFAVQTGIKADSRVPYGVAEYEAPNVVEGITQLAFLKSTATRLSWIPL